MIYIFADDLNFDTDMNHLEPDPDFRFTKLLPRKTEAATTKNLVLQCMVNDYRAPVRWFKGEEEILEDNKKFSVDKDFIGNCKLTIINAQKSDSGIYKCKIDNTKSVTKSVVTFEGREK